MNPPFGPARAGDAHFSAAAIAEDLQTVRERAPLVHNVTNFVVMQQTANALLAIGASPIMAHAQAELDELLGYAGALVLNIGTLDAPWISAMERALAAARGRALPVVLDPRRGRQSVAETALRLLGSGQVRGVPEEGSIKALTPDRSDQPFDEGMRDWSVPNRRDFVDLKDAQVGEPAVEAEQWVVIGAEVSWLRLPSDGVVEHPTYGYAVDAGTFDAKTDDAAREHVHDHQHPVTSWEDRFAAE